MFNINKLINILFHKLDNGVMITTTYRSPIYLITCMDLLPELLNNCMISDKSISSFFEKNNKDIISTFNNVYLDEINSKCNDIELEKDCKKLSRCKYINSKCMISDDAQLKSKDVKRTIQNFQENLIIFEQVLIDCYLDGKLKHYPVPFYLFGMVMTYYWFIVRNNYKTVYNNKLITKDISLKDWVKLYIDIVNNTIEKDKMNRTMIKIDKIMSNISFDTPPICNMTELYYRDKKFPNCVETTINDFFNVYLYNSDKKIFDTSYLPITANIKLIDFYDRLNNEMKDKCKSINYINENSVKRNFLDVVVDIPDVKYIHSGKHFVNGKQIEYGFEIDSTEIDIMKVISYCVGIKLNKIKDIEMLSNDKQKITIDKDVITFNIEDKNKVMKMIISKNHSYPEHKTLFSENDSEFIRNDNISLIILKILSVGDEEENNHPLIKLSKYNKKVQYYYVEVPDVSLDHFESNLYKRKELLELKLNKIKDIISMVKNLIYLIILTLNYSYINNFSELCILTNLEVLELSNNQIKIIPPEIGNLKKLRGIIFRQ